MNNRRKLLLVLGTAAFAAPLSALAQPVGKIFQIGYLGNSTPSMESALVEGFRQGLRERGYIEGKNAIVHYRWAEGKVDLIPALVAEMIALNVDVLVTSGTPAPLAAKKATTTLPIVMGAVGDAVAMGIVSSLARPGGNVTGLSSMSNQLEGKRFQILRELVPKMKRIALLTNPANPFSAVTLNSAQAASDALKVTAQAYGVSVVGEFEGAFAAIAKARPDAMVVLADRPLLVHNRVRIVQFAEQSRLPTIYPFSEFMDKGGLAYYGANLADMFRRSATYVDRILKGAKPADLPIEQPTVFELVINRKTAKALGLTIPQSLLISADKVIE
jgi:putative ABC transport system substrate-binding protein